MRQSSSILRSTSSLETVQFCSLPAFCPFLWRFLWAKGGTLCQGSRDRDFDLYRRVAQLDQVDGKFHSTHILPPRGLQHLYLQIVDRILLPIAARALPPVFEKACEHSLDDLMHPRAPFPVLVLRDEKRIRR